MRPFQGRLDRASIPWALPTAIQAHPYGMKSNGRYLSIPWALPTVIEAHPYGMESRSPYLSRERCPWLLTIQI